MPGRDTVLRPPLIDPCVGRRPLTAMAVTNLEALCNCPAAMTSRFRRIAAMAEPMLRKSLPTSVDSLLP